MPMSLEELRKVLNSPRKKRKPSTIWTRTAALDTKRVASTRKEKERRARLCIKVSSLDPLLFFYEKYARCRRYTDYKCSVPNFLRMSQDVYKVSKIIFVESDDIRCFFEEACEILNIALARTGSVTNQNRGLSRYVKRMTRLRAFWEINMQNDGAIIDKREKEVKELKKNLLYAYDYMKRQAIE